jgi:hypothetical protein
VSFFGGLTKLSVSPLQAFPAPGGKQVGPSRPGLTIYAYANLCTPSQLCDGAIYQPIHTLDVCTVRNHALLVHPKNQRHDADTCKPPSHSRTLHASSLTHINSFHNHRPHTPIILATTLAPLSALPSTVRLNDDDERRFVDDGYRTHKKQFISFPSSLLGIFRMLPFARTTVEPCVLPIKSALVCLSPQCNVGRRRRRLQPGGGGPLSGRRTTLYLLRVIYNNKFDEHTTIPLLSTRCLYTHTRPSPFTSSLNAGDAGDARRCTCTDTSSSLRSSLSHLSSARQKSARRALSLTRSFSCSSTHAHVDTLPSSFFQSRLRRDDLCASAPHENTFAPFRPNNRETEGNNTYTHSAASPLSTTSQTVYSMNVSTQM